jgi:hypothetical protein
MMRDRQHDDLGIPAPCRPGGTSSPFNLAEKHRGCFQNLVSRPLPDGCTRLCDAVFAAAHRNAASWSGSASPPARGFSRDLPERTRRSDFTSASSTGPPAPVVDSRSPWRFCGELLSWQPSVLRRQRALRNALTGSVRRDQGDNRRRPQCSAHRPGPA